MHKPSIFMAVVPLLLAAASALRGEAPKVVDGGYTLTLVAAEPEIVTPVGCTVDKKGRLLVIESHTHFRPRGYKGPPADRIRIVEDFGPDGRARKFTTFWEGGRFCMNLLTDTDGSIIVASRNEIFRLRDTKNAGIADEKTTLAHLETKGDYPHNGLAGLTLGPDGKIYFGIGENLGVPYKLIGSDGTSIADDGSNAGKVFVIDREGKGVKEVATGFWNPFGLAFGDYGQLFAVDNDSDGRPPCRLVHVVPGGDYGYQFRYGRGGNHPLQAWEGELPGTLPPICGVGEAPCAVLNFRGALWVTSWGDHRLDTYTLKPSGASFTATMKSIVTGGDDFRPVGLAVAHDGSLFFTDWVSKSYDLHGKGRIWRLSFSRPFVSQTDGGSPAAFDEAQKTLALTDLDTILHGLVSDDAILRAAAQQALSGHAKLQVIDASKFTDPRQRLGLLIARRMSHEKSHVTSLGTALQDSDPTVRLFAVRWIADDRLTDCRTALEKAMTEPVMTPRLFAAYLAALDRLDGRGVTPGAASLDTLVLKRLLDGKTTPAVRTIAMEMLASENGQLKVETLQQFFATGDARFRTAAVRWLIGKPDPGRARFLAEIAADVRHPVPLRADAVAGLGAVAAENVELLLKLAGDAEGALRDEARRSLRGAKLSDAQMKKLGDAPKPPTGRPPLADLAGWLKLTEVLGDHDTGRRIYFNRAVSACAGCHTIEARGAAVGPDLTMIGRSATRESVLKSLLDPGAEIAPRYTLWTVTRRSGESFAGMHLGDTGDDQIYIDAAGKTTRLPLKDIVKRESLPISIMPPNQLDALTDQEIRDLLAYLLQKR